MKKFKGYLLALAIFAIPSIYFAADGTIHFWTGKGPRHNTLEMELREPTVGTAADLLPGADNTNSLGTSSLAWDDVQTYDISVLDDLTLSSDTARVILGGSSAAVSTVTTSGESLGTTVSVYMFDGPTGVAASEGSVLVATAASPTAATSMTAQTSTGAIITNWIGIAAADISTGSVGQCFINGVVLALTTGTVAAGDLLVTTGTAVGYLATDNSDWGQRQGAIVGVAIGNGTAAGGLTKIRLR
jgi:hypothetical protein